MKRWRTVRGKCYGPIIRLIDFRVTYARSTCAGFSETVTAKPETDSEKPTAIEQHGRRSKTVLQGGDEVFADDSPLFIPLTSLRMHIRDAPFAGRRPLRHHSVAHPLCRDTAAEESFGCVRHSDRIIRVPNTFFDRHIRVSPVTQKSSTEGELHLAASDETSALVSAIYDELRALAAQYLRNERRGHTLRPSDLVHEAYLRMSQQTCTHWKNRSQFFALCATMMRRILVDYARHRAASKRQAVPGERPQWLEGTIWVGQPEELLTLDRALVKLTEIDPQQSRIVELRFFGGLSVREASEALAIPPATLQREWTLARAWLFREIGGMHAGKHGALVSDQESF